MFKNIVRVKGIANIFSNSLLQSNILNSSFGLWLMDGILYFDSNLNLLKEYQNIYVDVSIFAKNDNKTGIQRVVREVIFQLLSDKSIADKIKFVVATKGVAYREVGCRIIAGELKFDQVRKKDGLIKPSKNDIFLGLDFCPHIVPEHFLRMIKWKKSGVRFAWVLYDMIPLYNPQWFTSNITECFRSWINAILLLSDVVLCISQTVEQQARSYANNLGLDRNFSTIRLGYGFRKQEKTAYFDSTNAIIQEQFNNKPFVLMVSTLEPRKGYVDILAALNEIWDDHASDVSIVIVGQQGWNVDSLMKSICMPKHKNRIYWLSSVNDELLFYLYQASLGVIVASYDEGYGLPLIEAIAHDKHILVRNTKIFQEVTQNYHNICYFSSDNCDLIMCLREWLNNTIYEPTKTNALSNSFDKGWELTLQDIKDSITN